MPLPSPASGFTYQLDPSTGVFQRSTRSFGPILAERADTIGASHTSLGFAFQRFTFDTIEDLDLNRVPAVFTHDNAHLLGGRQDVVTTVNSITANVSQYTTFFTIGVTDRFDVSVAVPIIATDLNVVSEATIERLGTTNPLTHFFRLSNGDIGDRRLFTAQRQRQRNRGPDRPPEERRSRKPPQPAWPSGWTCGCRQVTKWSCSAAARPGLQPFVIWSATYQKVSPHVNAGYQWNGSSVLAGNPATGEAADFPDQVTYVAGADVACQHAPHVCLRRAGPLRDRCEAAHAPRISMRSTASPPSRTSPFENDSFGVVERCLRREGERLRTAAGEHEPALQPRRARTARQGDTAHWFRLQLLRRDTRRDDSSRRALPFLFGPILRGAGPREVRPNWHCRTGRARAWLGTAGHGGSVGRPLDRGVGSAKGLARWADRERAW